jgi:hypothetical protein
MFFVVFGCTDVLCCVYFVLSSSVFLCVLMVEQNCIRIIAYPVSIIFVTQN